MSLPYAADFRGHPACPCQAEWIPALEAEAQSRGIITGALSIAQLIGGAAASGGTHSTGGASDFWPSGDPDELVALCRQMGADATWHRHRNWDGKGGSEHIHSVLTGCPHNGPAAYQINAVRAGFNGLGHLGRGAVDDGPRPLSGRTFREGITWAEESDVSPDQEDRIVKRTIDGVLKALTEGKPDGSEFTRDQLIKRINKAAAEGRDFAKKAAGS